ncbi:hypothetical protein [Desulfatirhabdium butyrativorans]|uniref:hypothetical protein n=1 Tax=Desulfatirhabdium butyrativorans TaxID=340467 RepID=UPI000485C6F2|nr:hypothetical protein [Desulfatirhabdium butyrativorans]
MKNIVTNAAGITVLRLIDNTLKTGGGPISIGATVVQSPKGAPGKVLKVTHVNWEDILGVPYTKIIPDRTQMEGLRHLADAVKECNYVNVVRVLASDARFPTLAMKQIDVKGAWTPSTTYAVNDVVSITGGSKLICVVEHTSGSVEPTAASANWDAATDKGDWVTGTEYAVNDLVTISDDSKLVCVNAHTAGVSEPTAASSDWDAANDLGAWVAGTSYVVGDVVTVSGGTISLICVTAHTAGSVEPTAASSDWDAYTTPMVTDAIAYGTEISTASGYIGTIYPVDGDPGVNRSFTITNIDAVKKRFTIKFYDIDETGTEYLLEYWTVGVDPSDKDDMGRSVFIETLLEERSSRFRCDWNTDVDWDDAFDTITAIAGLQTKPAFAGGTNGGTPTTQDWISAWDMFRNEQVLAYLMFMAGNYTEDVIANAIDIAEIRHTMLFFDVPPYLDSGSAITWLTSASLSSRLAAAYYCPLAAKDAWYGGKTVWGASGAAVAACALGDANFTGDTPGVHYSPAGINRGVLSRTGVELLFPDDVIDRDALYDARINPVIINGNGSAMIDDALTVWPKANYSRFVWVNRIANYIDHQFLEMAGYMEHEPDGITYRGLYKGMKSILDKLVTAGALVSPRTDSGGDQAYTVTVAQSTTDSNPYVFTVEQPEIDRWLVTWSFCPVGSARRIVGQPILIL